MKSLLFILFFTPLLFSQINPDGYIGGVSIHVIPYLDYGSGKYYNYGTEFRDLNLPTNFNVDFLLKVPITKSATIGGYFSWSQFENEYITDVNYQITSKGNRYKLGMTFSLYTGG